MSPVIPYPAPWARMVDFFPSLYYSIQLAPTTPLLQYHGHVSTSKKTAKEYKKPVKTELGEVSINPTNRSVLNYKAGSPDNATTFEAKDVWNEVQSFAKVPDITGKRRIILKPVPKLLKEHNLLSTDAPLKIVETAKGCYSRKLREVTRLPLFNIIRYAKNELLRTSLADYSEPETLTRFKRMRSIWKTETIYGWSDLGSVIRPLCQELTKNQWFQDTIEVKGFNIPINHVLVDGQIYTMHKLRRLLAI